MGTLGRSTAGSIFRAACQQRSLKRSDTGRRSSGLETSRSSERSVSPPSGSLCLRIAPVAGSAGSDLGMEVRPEPILNPGRRSRRRRGRRRPISDRKTPTACRFPCCGRRGFWADRTLRGVVAPASAPCHGWTAMPMSLAITAVTAMAAPPRNITHSSGRLSLMPPRPSSEERPPEKRRRGHRGGHHLRRGDRRCDPPHGAGKPQASRRPSLASSRWRNLATGVRLVELAAKSPTG